MTLLRIQDKEGRGPWRPGLSKLWASDDPHALDLPPVHVEFKDFARLIAFAGATRMHIGCAVRGEEGIRRWFTLGELAKLRGLGFNIVECGRCIVLAETENQAIIASHRPLSKLPRVPWPVSVREMRAA
jgi:hypothetical protein